MPDPDHEERNNGQDPALGSEDARDSASVSSLELFRRIILGIVQAVGEGAELVSASVEEELARFLIQMERKLLLLMVFLVGTGLITAGGALLLQQLIGNWPIVLLLLGIFYMALGLLLFFQWRRPGGGN